MINKLLSARFLTTVLVITTLCVITTVIIFKCFLMPEAYDKLKDIIMVIVGGFIATVTSITTAYFNRSDRSDVKSNQGESK